MTDLDPLWLRSFVAIAGCASITRAAQQVHRTQSAVSTHLQQLEAALGVRLVHRSTRALALTADGERFLPHAQRLIAWQEEAHRALRPPEQAPVWRVGISEYFMPSRLGELLGVLRDAAPQAQIELLWTSSAALQRLWAAGEVDLAVVTSVTPVAGARLLRREPLAWVVGAGQGVPADAAVPLVLLGPECPVRPLALAALARAGRAHRLQLSCSGSHGAVAAIRAGWGVGCLNVGAIAPDLVMLSRRQPRAWPSPGRLSFYALARPALRELELALRRWASG